MKVTHRRLARRGFLAFVAVLLCGSTAAAAPPQRRAPHHSAIRMADQLQKAANRVEDALGRLPAPQTHSEKAVTDGAAAFVAETGALRRHLTRWLVDKRPAMASLDALNKHAWSMHRQLDRAPQYRSVFPDWARVVSILRRLNRELGPRR